MMFQCLYYECPYNGSNWVQIEVVLSVVYNITNSSWHFVPNDSLWTGLSTQNIIWTEANGPVCNPKNIIWT